MRKKVFVVARNVNRGGALLTGMRALMTQHEVGYHRLSAACGVNHETLRKVATGVGGIELRKAEAIAAALDTTAGELFCHRDGADLVGA